MALKSIQLCHIDRVTVHADDGNDFVWEVTVHSDTQQQLAVFRCQTETDGLALRNAIREHAMKLRRVADYDR